MRLKSKSVTLVALLVLTTMPRALDQLSDLSNLAQERFRTELLNIFWSLTAPETRRGSTKQYSELLARTQTNTSRCDRSGESRTPRAARAFNGFAPATEPAAPSALEHQQPWGPDETPATGRIAKALPMTEWNWEIPKAVEHAPAVHQTGAQPDRQPQAEKVLLVAENQKGHALFDEAALPPQVEDAVAELDFNQDETAATPTPGAVASPKREAARERFAQKFVQQNFQLRLPENPGMLPSEKFINNSTLIMLRSAFPQAKAKCRVRLIRVAPEAARPLADKPAIIS